jgi:hypothetical protein
MWLLTEALLWTNYVIDHSVGKVNSRLCSCHPEITLLFVDSPYIVGGVRPQAYSSLTPHTSEEGAPQDQENIGENRPKHLHVMSACCTKLTYSKADYVLTSAQSGLPPGEGQ